MDEDTHAKSRRRVPHPRTPLISDELAVGTVGRELSVPRFSRASSLALRGGVPGVRDREHGPEGRVQEGLQVPRVRPALRGAAF